MVDAVADRRAEEVMDERVAVCDAQGRVVGAAPRSQVYAEGLWHGSAGVLVRSTDGLRLYVHRRTTTKAVFAGMHDCLAGGVIEGGEGWGEREERGGGSRLTGETRAPWVWAVGGGEGGGGAVVFLFCLGVPLDGPRAISRRKRGRLLVDRGLGERLAARRGRSCRIPGN